MQYVPVPVAMLETGRSLPVDMWSPDGRLLLRKGQSIVSEQQKRMLEAHEACMTPVDANAWQKSFERVIRAMLRDGIDIETIAHTCMPEEILESDYIVTAEVNGGWLDLQIILQGLLYQGEAAISPLSRLQGIQQKALELLKSNPDECLFILFQALADPSLGYCATHALLCAVVCELTAEKLGVSDMARNTLFNAALVMNIGMAREQDRMARQTSIINDAQRKLIKEHPQKSHDILRTFGVDDIDQLDIVLWHHEADETHGLAGTLECRRILRVADGFVAKMASRKTRLAMSPMGAVKAIFLESTQGSASPGAAMATALGFYPPGTYVQLVNGEKAVSVARGRRANNPHVVSIINPGGMPLSKYIYRDTTDPHFAIRSPINAEKVKVKVSLEKALKARAERGADPEPAPFKA
ncbi:MAG: hypothetical protein KBF98_03165 [Rhodoferax sp.]|nr:hypothetical protein [Rhodoferax sp.]MBP9684383.1 hypothetical protein [Rhodoferax sp.]